MYLVVSIHASVKDATAHVLGGYTINGVSIHASVKDATSSFGMEELPDKRFNPRICKRCDIYQLINHKAKYVSIHASVKDAT